MKKTKRAFSLLLALVLAAMMFPVSTYAASPSISTPATISIIEDTETALLGITFSDPDGDLLTVNFIVASGTLYASSGYWVAASGNGTMGVVLTGSAADINSYIAGSNLKFLPAPNSDSGTLSIIVNDGTGGSDTKTLTMNVTAMNDAPVNTVPGAQSVMQNGTLVFSAGNGNAISVSDVDAGAYIIRVSLTVSNGLLTLGGTAGLNFVVGSGSNHETMTFEGTIVDINSALQGMSFSPTGGYYGLASLQIVTNDVGWYGSGGSKIDTDTIAISVLTLSPTIVSVDSSTADGMYGVGDTVTILMVFNQTVTVVGIPKLLLETGVNDRFAYYSSGSGSSVLAFSYTVQAGDSSSDLNYASIDALVLDSGCSISSVLDGTPAIRTLPALNSANSLASQSGLVISGAVAPAIAGPASMALTAGYAATATSAYTVTGYPAPTVTKTSGNNKIIWNSTTNKLEIAAGLLAGSYPVVLTASNGVNPDATLSFTLVVNAAPYVPSITGLPSSYTLYPGSHVTWTPQRAGGVWNYNHEFLSMTQNGDQYTFTALKKGTTTVTYSIPGASWPVSLTIGEIAVPNTGDEAASTGFVLLGLAALCAACVVIRRREA